MAWKVWVDPFETSTSITDTTYFQPMKFDADYIIHYTRASLAFQNSPTFCDMVMKVYGNDDQAATPQPTELLHTSTNNFSLSDITTEAHGVKDVYYKFSPFHVKQGVFYNFVINADCYFPTATSFLGIEKAYPNPIQKETYIPATINVPNSPYKIYAIGSKL